MDYNLNRDCGQLWYDDRKWLYETVFELKPKVAIETGTWNGGGSTFYIARALHDSECEGVLHTFELDENLFIEARSNYQNKWPHLKPFVTFWLGPSTRLIPLVVNLFLSWSKLVSEKLDPIDFIFLDSANDPPLMRQEFELLAPHLRIGGVLMAHDWFNGKADELKPLLTNNPNWKLETIGDGTGCFEHGSVGLAKLTKLS